MPNTIKKDVRPKGVQEAILLLRQSGYYDDAAALADGDPELLMQIRDPAYMAWLRQGSPPPFNSAERIRLTRRAERLLSTQEVQEGKHDR